jgi:hypothetical protein
MPKPKSNEEILEALRSNPAYAHVDIDIEVNKAAAWCLANNRVCTPRFFVNWINRIQPPLRPSRPSAAADTSPAEPDDPVCPFCGESYCLRSHREDI